jgi:hypothetical protein
MVLNLFKKRRIRNGTQKRREEIEGGKLWKKSKAKWWIITSIISEALL